MSAGRVLRSLRLDSVLPRRDSTHPHKPLRSQSPTHKLSSVQWAVQDGVCFYVRTSQTMPFELGVVLYGLQDVSVLSENPMYEAFVSSSSRVRAHRQTTSPPTASSAPLYFMSCLDDGIFRNNDASVDLFKVPTKTVHASSTHSILPLETPSLCRPQLLFCHSRLSHSSSCSSLSRCPLNCSTGGS